MKLSIMSAAQDRLPVFRTTHFAKDSFSPQVKVRTKLIGLLQYLTCLPNDIPDKPFGQ